MSLGVVGKCLGYCLKKEVEGLYMFIESLIVLFCMGIVFIELCACVNGGSGEGVVFMHEGNEAAATSFTRCVVPGCGGVENGCVGCACRFTVLYNYCTNTVSVKEVMYLCCFVYFIVLMFVFVELCMLQVHCLVHCL